ncbi:uncharacterized protein LOC127854294 [Dreissena polymorpha]|uniref:Uncharacterized protein n=1 Tax=Dreissena polymorpha TaxID=45954 RepID=A0A9D4HRW0_DREPO|nr:uncharacterized protein LOC127854294 [Dreissena polymorpha]KAH3730842.1 hypothetical protein DPMN_056840 [Dreissena polymorpha]
MSVQKNYLRKHLKVVPVPQTSTQLEDARNAVMRRFSRPQHPAQEHSTGFANVQNAERNVYVNASPHDKKDFRSHVYRPYIKNYNKYDINGRLIKRDADTYAHAYKEKLSPDTDVAIEATRRKSFGSDTGKDETGSRPMTARPDSRWERRDYHQTEESQTAFVIENELGQLAPMKIPGEKRSPRVGYTPRGKIELGRQSKTSAVSLDSFGRPQSRRSGKIKNMHVNKDIPETTHTPQELNLHHQINTGSPSPASRRAHVNQDAEYELDHVIFGLEDIDLDVDPVAYFNYEYKFDSFGSVKRPLMKKSVGNTFETNGRYKCVTKNAFDGNHHLKTDEAEHIKRNAYIASKIPVSTKSFGLNDNLRNNQVHAFPQKQRHMSDHGM